MRVLGVDPGLTRCGIGVVDALPGRRAALVHVEVLRTSTDLELADRLLLVADGLDRVLARHHPDVLAVEQVFSQSNVTSVMGTAQASGVAVLAGARAGIPVVLHTPTEVKAAVTGSGQAGKAQVTSMVTRILSLSSAPRPADAADALALAICQLWRGQAADARVAAAAGAGSGAGAGAGGSRQLTAAQQVWLEASRQARRR